MAIRRLSRPNDLDHPNAYYGASSLVFYSYNYFLRLHLLTSVIVPPPIVMCSVFCTVFFAVHKFNGIGLHWSLTH